MDAKGSSQDLHRRSKRTRELSQSLRRQYRELQSTYHQVLERQTSTIELSRWALYRARDGMAIFEGGRLTVANRRFYALCSPGWQWVHLDAGPGVSAGLLERLLALAEALPPSRPDCDADTPTAVHLFRRESIPPCVVEAEFERLPESPGRLVVQLREVTEREALREQEAESHRRDEFLATMAHELKNAMAPITAAASLIFSQAKNPELRHAAETILRQAGHEARLVEDLLDTARVQKGKILLQCERLDLRRLLEEGASAIAEQCLARSLRMEVSLPDEPAWVEVDPTRIVQAVVNLLSNAVKYTEPGGEVRLSLEVGKDTAWVRVRDTGIGLAPEMLPRIFDPFAQAENSREQSGGGLGLGLPLVRNLAELHRGGVRSASDGLGKGCEFTLWLPLAQPAPRGAPAAPPDSAFSPASSKRKLTPNTDGPNPTGTPRRILVVDDQPDAADTLRDLLECSGHQVEVAYSAPHAIDLAMKHAPELVLCDLRMPGMDGCALATALRRRPQTAAARLVALTGLSTEEAAETARAAGFDRYLTKPISLPGLEKLIAELPER